jgi:outer membrane protein, adhesin transport system
MLQRTLLAAFFVGVAGLSFQLQAETLDLREAIAQTIKSNPEVLAELRETDARERQVREARGGYYPTVDLLAGFGFQERDPTAEPKVNNSRNELERSEAQINLRQLVFDGFDTTNEYRNQQSRLESSTFRASSVGETVALEVARTYFDVMKQEDVQVLTNQTLVTHQDIYEKMKKRFDSGVGSRADLDQISSRLALAKTNAINQNANVLDAKANFQRVVGRFPAKGELVNPGTYKKYLPASVDDAVVKAISNHPLLKSAASDIDAVNFTYEQTKSAFYPHFHVEVERDLNDNIDGVEGQVDDLKVMLRMRYNLFRGRSDEARTQQYAHLVEKAKEVRNNTHRQVEQETRLSWVAYEAIRDQLPLLEDYVRDAQLTKDAYVKQFDLGRRTLLDLLNTENEMISARESLARANHDALLNEYRLFHAMGELLFTVGVEI